MSSNVPDDFVDVIACLNQERYDFIIVGAYALAAHGSPRATGDIDVLVRPSEENADRVFRALARFGAPLVSHGLTKADFSAPGTVYQMGLPPFRIDILTEISGVSFDEAAVDAISGERNRCVSSGSMPWCATSEGRAGPRISPMRKRSRKFALDTGERPDACGEGESRSCSSCVVRERW